MTKEKRANKWSFIIYEESAPKDYLDILESIHVPFVLSPWHNKDINKSTGELKKSHKHGAFYFDSLKSYKQVSDLINEKLNAPTHVEIVQSPTGLYEYFTHAKNPDKASYDIEDMEYGCGFDIEKFKSEQNKSTLITKVIDIIDNNNYTEFKDIVEYVKENDLSLLTILSDNTYFFTRYIDSKRHYSSRK